MENILVPTDFSEESEKALKVAAQIAEKNDSKLYIHHSTKMPLHLANTSSGVLPESLFFIKIAEKEFEQLLKRPYLQEIELHQTIGHGDLSQDIQEVCEKNDIDIIIMGSHGASGHKQMFIGHNTEKVVRSAKVPVLVIKNEHENFKIDNFLFATDLEDECHSCFKQAQSLAANFNANLHVLYVNTPGFFKTSSETQKMMNTFKSKNDLKNTSLHIYNDQTVEKGILNFSKENDIHLIGMATHGRKGLSHFFNGSISEDLVNHANRPVITFKI